MSEWLKELDMDSLGELDVHIWELTQELGDDYTIGELRDLIADEREKR